MKTLHKVLSHDAPTLVRVLAQLITKLIQSPDDMRLWLKFDSQNLSVNSSGRPITLRIHGKPSRMPPDRGIYTNWGAFFNLGDSLDIPNGLDHKGFYDKAGIRDMEQPQLEWTIYFCTIYPLEFFKGKVRTLIQAYDGKGAYI